MEHAKNPNTVSIDVEAAYKILNEDQETGRERVTDRYQEQTFLLAAADSLVESPEIMAIDRVAEEANQRATRDGSTMFDALKALMQEADTEQDDGYAATDLLNAYIDMTAAYVVSREKQPARGFAKGLLTMMEMRLASAPTDRSNPVADELRVDLALVRPIVEEFIEGYNSEYNNPNDFKDYLETSLEMEEVDLRSAKLRNAQPNPETERRVQAMKSALVKLEELQSGYAGNLENLQDTAIANHRVIK